MREAMLEFHRYQFYLDSNSLSSKIAGKKLWSLPSIIVLAALCLARTQGDRGEVILSNRKRLMFDVDDSQIDAYAAKMNC